MGSKDHWRERVRNAQRAYREAQAITNQARKESLFIPAPDGSFVFRRALQAETAALHEYARSLKVFSNLVLHDVDPPDNL